MTAEAINAATRALKKALIERALGGEMNHHLGYAPGAAKPASVTNQRNGRGAKTVLTESAARSGSKCRATGTAASSRC
nr:transposase [Paraburkholderia tropica]